jgi:hypothetical protein
LPNLLIAAAARRTSRIRFASMVNILPPGTRFSSPKRRRSSII